MKSVGGYSIPAILQRFIGILLLPLYTHYLRPSDYAVLELLDLAGSVASLLLGMRLGQALFYFYHHADSDTERDSYVMTALVGATAVGLVAASVLSLPAAPLSSVIFGSSQYTGLLRVFLVGFAASFPLELGLSYLRVSNLTRTYTRVLNTRIAAGLVLNVLFLAAFHMGLWSIVWTAVIVNNSLSLFLVWKMLSRIRPSFSYQHLREMVRYSAPLAVSGLGDFLLHFGDRIFLRPNVPLAALGLYSLAYKFGMMVAYASDPFFQYWNSQMVGIVRSPGGERVYVRVATYLLLGFSFAALLVTVFAEPGIALAAAPDYRPAAAIIPWIALAYVMRGMGAYFLNTFLLKKRSTAVAQITWLAAGACVVGYALLIPKYKVWGAVMATLIGFAFSCVVGLWKSQQARPFAYEYKRWLQIAVSAIAAVTLYYLVRPTTPGPQIAVGTGAVLLFPSILFALGFLTPEERVGLRKAAGWIKQRSRRYSAA